MAGTPSDRVAVTAATAASAALVAFQLAGKATRDALYLSVFDVTALPRMVIAASVLSALVTIGLSRVMARVGPGRLLPWLVGGSALTLLVEWGLSATERPAMAVLFYLHYSALGALVISGFWALVTERFDPRTARGTIGRITAGASVGGLIGGVLPERVGAALPLVSMLPLLAVLQLVAAALLLVLRTATPAGSADPPGPVSSLRQTFSGSPYLRRLALLVALTAMTEGLLDWTFKSRATASGPSGEELLRLFAVLYTVTALLAVIIQTTALRPLLARLGVARSAALLPAGVSLGAVSGLLVPGLLPLLLARGAEIILRNSIFRGAYELLFTPVPAAQKRATKLLVDVGAARVGDVAGGILIQATLLVAAAWAGGLLLALTIVLALLALLVARRLHRGYVSTLAGNLARHANQMAPASADDAASLLQTAGGFDLSQLRWPAPAPALTVPMPEPATTEQGDPESRRLGLLRSGAAAAVRGALLQGPLTPPLAELAIELLAWDEVAPAAMQALRGVAPDETDRLLGHLLDPQEDFAVRRRLVPVVAQVRTPAVVEGLLAALNDRRFEVRYRAGRALSHLLPALPQVVVERERVLAVVLREVEVGRGVWEGRQLIDAVEDEWEPMAAEVLRRRASRSLEHVFTLLSLVFPRSALRLAYDALHTDDRHLRGTALEYLESVLPGRVRVKLWEFLEPGEWQQQDRQRSPEEVLADLVQSRESIVLALAEVRRRSGPVAG